MCGPNVAPSLGPVLGGALANSVGWRWIFWFLCILSGLCLVIICMFLPETARQVVGNGAVSAKGINQNLLNKCRGKPFQKPSVESASQISRFRIFNPIRCLSVIFYKDTASVLLVNAIFYMIYCCIQASLSSSFISIYHYQELEAGLIYLPFGFGCALASYVSGKLINRDYHVVAKQHSFTIDRVKGDDMTHFPLEKARLRSVWLVLAIVLVSVAGYGWTLETKTHVAAPLSLQFLIGATTTVIFNLCGTLAVDLNPDRPSTVSAGSNLMRCSLSAVGLAVLQITIDGVGIGWCYTIFAALGGITVPLLMMERNWGPVWRAQRDSKLRGRNAERRESKKSYIERPPEVTAPVNASGGTLDGHVQEGIRLSKGIK